LEESEKILQFSTPMNGSKQLGEKQLRDDAKSKITKMKAAA
jgi:hypothetical protein